MIPRCPGYYLRLVDWTMGLTSPELTTVMRSAAIRAIAKVQNSQSTSPTSSSARPVRLCAPAMAQVGNEQDAKNTRKGNESQPSIVECFGF